MVRRYILNYYDIRQESVITRIMRQIMSYVTWYTLDFELYFGILLPPGDY